MDTNNSAVPSRGYILGNNTSCSIPRFDKTRQWSVLSKPLKLRPEQYLKLIPLNLIGTVVELSLQRGSYKLKTSDSTPYADIILSIFARACRVAPMA